MKTARFGTTLGLAAMLLAGCGASTADGGGVETRETDASAPYGDSATVGGPDAGSDAGAGLADVLVPTEDVATPSPPNNADVAASFEAVATCPARQFPGGVRFRAPGVVRRNSSETDLASSDGCVALGPALPSATGAFVELATVSFAASPVVYVREGATGGDGTAASPYGRLEDALAHLPAPRTVVLAAGSYTLPPRASGGTVVSSELTLIGRSGSAESTTTVRAEDRGAFEVRGANASLSLVNLVLTSPATAAPLVSVNGGAALFVQNSALSGGDDSVRVEGAGSSAEFAHARIERGARTSVRAGAGARVVLRQSRVDIGTEAGVWADGAAASATETAVMPRDPEGGGAALPSGEGIVLVGDAPGGTDRLDRVVVRSAMRAGLRIEGGRRVAASLIEATDTRADATGAVGVYVSSGSSLTIDDGAQPVINGAVDTEFAGRGSLVGGNLGPGVLATGASTTIALNGALVERNGGPGVVLQNEAAASRLSLLDLNHNAAAGLMVTSGASVVSILDDLIHDAQPGTLTLADGSVMRLQVGVVLAGARPSAGSPISILDDLIHDNGEYDGFVVNSVIDVKDLVTTRFIATGGTTVTGNSSGSVMILDDLIVPSLGAGRVSAATFGALRVPFGL